MRLVFEALYMGVLMAASDLDMPFWRKIVNDYREGFHGVISQPKSPKIANFGKPSENCWQ